MTIYSIRPAQAIDLPALPAIEKAAAELFRNTAEALTIAYAGMPLSAFEEHFVHNRIWVAVWQAAQAQEQLVGFAVACKLDGTVYLHEIDVHPAHGRRGLGQRLIEAVIAWASAEWLPAVTLSTFRDVPWNAPYYAKLGFQLLADEALTPGLCEVRAHEAAAGLDITRRVCMIRHLS